jgi:hypothetical protein
VPLQDPLVAQLQAAAKLDWRQPGRFTRLPVLLGLRAIDESSGGARDPAFRVAALREVLREAIARLERDAVLIEGRPERPAALAASWLFGLAPGAEELRIGARRQRAAAEWGVPVESFRRHMQTAVYVALAAELRRLSGDEHSAFGPVSPAGQAVLEALESYYGVLPKLGTLATTVVSPKPHYDDVTVELILTDDADDDTQYTLEYRVGFQADISEYVVAFITRASLGDAIMVKCPRVNDRWAFSDKGTLTEYLRRLEGAESPVRVFGKLESGLSQVAALQLRMLQEDEAAPYIRGLDPHERSEVTLLRAEVPSWPLGPFRFVTRFVFPMKKSDRYCYWAAERPTYLRRLTFDANNFDPQTGAGFRATPFLGVAVTEMERESPRVIRLEIQNWLVSGQGAVFSWG